MVGDPSLEVTQQRIAVLSASGVDLIELGVPFSDPIADGPTIAAAASRALANGVDLPDVLDLVRANRAMPIAIFSYYNPLLQYGLDAFARDAANAGARAIIIPDLALENTVAASRAFGLNGMMMPSFVAPTTTPERLAQIATRATGFIYVVSRVGVTGEGRHLELDRLAQRVIELRRLTPLPLAVGFGITSPEDVSAIARFADAVVVGSALIEAYARSGGDCALELIRLTKALTPA